MVGMILGCISFPTFPQTVADPWGNICCNRDKIKTCASDSYPCLDIILDIHCFRQWAASMYFGDALFWFNWFWISFWIVAEACTSEWLLCHHGKYDTNPIT